MLFFWQLKRKYLHSWETWLSDTPLALCPLIKFEITLWEFWEIVIFLQVCLPLKLKTGFIQSHTNTLILLNQVVRGSPWGWEPWGSNHAEKQPRGPSHHVVVGGKFSEKWTRCTGMTNPPVPRRDFIFSYQPSGLLKGPSHYLDNKKMSSGRESPMTVFSFH